MKHYYSASTGGFYSDLIHGARKIEVAQTAAEIVAKKRPGMIANPDCRIPDDAVEISTTTWEELFQAQAEGMSIQTQGGKPVAVEPTVDEAARVATRRRKRDQLLAASDWTQVADSPLDAVMKKAWAAYRQALRDLDMTGTDWPDEPTRGMPDGAA